MLKDRALQKFLFLNQFGLKQIYDKVCNEQADHQKTTDTQEERKSTNKKRSRSTKVVYNKKRLSDIESIKEE